MFLQTRFGNRQVGTFLRLSRRPKRGKHGSNEAMGRKKMRTPDLVNTKSEALRKKQQLLSRCTNVSTLCYNEITTKSDRKLTYAYIAQTLFIQIIRITIKAIIFQTESIETYW